MVLHNITDVPDHRVVMVTPLKVLKKPEEGARGRVAREWEDSFLPSHSYLNKINTNAASAHTQSCV